MLNRTISVQVTSAHSQMNGTGPTRAMLSAADSMRSFASRKRDWFSAIAPASARSCPRDRCHHPRASVIHRRKRPRVVDRLHQGPLLYWFGYGSSTLSPPVTVVYWPLPHEGHGGRCFV